MYRSLAAFLVLVSLPMVSASDVQAKAAITAKKPVLTKPVAKKQEVVPTAAQNVKTVVREQSAVIIHDQGNFNAPEGALYTTSDECG